MRQYVARRFFLFVPTLLLTTLIVFVLFFLVPGDAALFILTGEEGAGAVTEQDIINLRHELGLDRPIHIQYGSWLWGIVQGDLEEKDKHDQGGQQQRRYKEEKSVMRRQSGDRLKLRKPPSPCQVTGDGG